MNQTIVIHSLEELGQYAGLVAQDDELPEPPVTAKIELANDLASLAAATSRAVSYLQELIDQDTVARREAESAVSQHYRLQEEIEQLERIQTEAVSVQERAASLAESGFSPHCRNEAAEVGEAVGGVALTARATLVRLRHEAEELAGRHDVARVLHEEAERAEAMQREDAERQQNEAMRKRVEAVELLLRQGQQNEAEELLGHLLTEKPNDSSVASSVDNLRRRIWGVKTIRVEEALQEARRLHRHEPRRALESLERLDLTAMPEELVRQVYGCWLHACRRLRFEGALHYSPAFGKGAVLTPAGLERLEVVSAIGLPRWHAGATFAASGLRSIRPLS